MISISILVLFSLINSTSAIDSSNPNDTSSGDLSLDESVTDSIKSPLSSSSEIFVSANGSDETGLGDVKSPYSSLKQAIEESDDGNTINLENGIYTGDNNKNLLVSKNLTIKGENATIDAQNSSRIFTVSNASLTLIGLNLINANTPGESGGTIINMGGELSLINCTIANSQTDQNAGAIFSNGTLNLIDTRIINNSAHQYGGAIFSIGLLNVNGCHFEANTVDADKSVGGTIMTSGLSHFNNSTFLTNHAVYSAAAISSYGNVDINNTNFINQSTNYTGGAISNHGNMTINNSLFSNCHSRFYAAAILAPPSGLHVTTEVYNTIFRGNNVGNHGAVSNNFQDTELLMINCALVDNYIQQDLVPIKQYGDIALDDNATTLYCWWGQNEVGNYYSPHGDEYEPWKINASRWLVMTFESDKGLAYSGELNSLTVSIKQYFDNNTKEICPYDEDINLPLSVRLYTDNGEITRLTLKNGTASYNYRPSASLKYVYASMDNQTLAIELGQREDVNIIAEDFSKIYGEDKELSIKLTDSNNESIANKSIKIKIDNAEYEKTTNDDGTVEFDINISPKTIDAIVSFDGDEEYKKINRTIKLTVVKKNTSIIASNLVKYYKNGTQLKIKLLDNDKKALANKKIQITINKKTYARTTNAKGIASLTINNKIGTYSTKIQFKGDIYLKASGKTITVKVVKPILKAKSTKVHKKSNFVVTFKDKSKKLIKNQKVKFTLNKKTYTRTTNSKGQASVKVNLAIGNTYSVKTQFKSTKLYGAYVLTTKIKVIK